MHWYLETALCWVSFGLLQPIVKVRESTKTRQKIKLKRKRNILNLLEGNLTDELSCAYGRRPDRVWEGTNSQTKIRLCLGIWVKRRLYLYDLEQALWVLSSNRYFNFLKRLSYQVNENFLIFSILSASSVTRWLNYFSILSIYISENLPNDIQNLQSRFKRMSNNK